jgi:hypothetical protein
MKTAATILLPALLLLVVFPATAQSLTRELPVFDKIAVSPLIHLVLEKGEQEGVRLEYNGIEPEKINCKVEGKTLRIYLEDARMTVKNRTYYRDGNEYREPVYGNHVTVTAYVTYRQLRSIEKRGSESVTCGTPLEARKFTLRLFGENQADLATVESPRLKAALFGENKLTIGVGQSERQRYRTFGENTIDARKVTGSITSTSSFGENQFRLNASDQIRVMAFGETNLTYTGGGHLTRRLVVGESSIRSIQ